MAAAAKSLQLCPTLCDPVDSSPAGPSVHGILQARRLEWVAISFSKSTWSQRVMIFVKDESSDKCLLVVTAKWLTSCRSVRLVCAKGCSLLFLL